MSAKKTYAICFAYVAALNLYIELERVLIAFFRRFQPIRCQSLCHNYRFFAVGTNLQAYDVKKKKCFQQHCSNNRHIKMKQYVIIMIGKFIIIELDA